MQEQKWAVIFGGCGTRGQRATKRAVDAGFTVVVVDNTTDPSRQPEAWPAETNCNDSRNFAFYHEDMITFLTQDHCLSNTKWSLVINCVRIKDIDYMNESITNAITDAIFFKWYYDLPSPRPQMNTNFDSVIGSHVLKHKHLWADQMHF